MQIVRYDAYLCAEFPDVPGLLSQQPNPGIGFDHRVDLAVDDFEQCRLARAVRTDDGHLLVLLDAQVEAVEHPRAAAKERGVVDVDQRRVGSCCHNGML